MREEGGMSSEKRVSRTRRKNNLLKGRLDFHVPETKVDPCRSKNIPTSKLKEEQSLSTMDEGGEAEDDKEEFVHENWEDRLIEDETQGNNNNSNNNSNNNNITSSLTASSVRGRTYPDDLWFLLGGYIHPESVQTFGQLCRASQNVLKTFKFWSSLYERTFQHCKRIKSLEQKQEETLRVSLVVRPFQVKYHVIRALFTIYPPFKESLDRQKLNSVDFDELRGYRPVTCWRPGNQLKDGVFLHNILLKKGREKQTRIDKTLLFNEMSEAVSYNPFQDTIVLQIVTDHPNKDLNAVIGMHLINVTHNTSRDMRNMRLELDFSTENFYPPRVDRKLTLDPVKRVRIFPWWHPNFPIIETNRIDNDNSTTSSSWDS